MVRTLVILVLLGLLVVSAGGNALQLQQAAQRNSEVERLRARVAASEPTRQALDQRVTELQRENERLKAGASSGTPPSVPSPSVFPSPGASTAPAADPSGGPDRALLSRIEEQVQQLRGLRKKADVPLNLLDRVALRKYFTDSFERDYLPQDREVDQKLLTTLGLLPRNESLIQILLDLLQEQVIGIYDDEQRAMYVIGDRATFGPEEKLTYAHEFAHALQDQYFDLGTFSPKQPENDDQALARHAVAEGDATLTQRLWMQDNLTPEEIAKLVQGTGGDSKLDQAPLIVRAELLFPYVNGATFVRQAYQSGGTAALDDLFRNPPNSTEQVLHPEKYRQGEQPVDVALADLAQALGDGWVRLDGNTLGELDLRTLLEQYGDNAVAARAATGWGGDRWQLLEKDGRQAVVLASVWDTELDAREYFDALGQGFVQRFRGATVDESSPARQALTTTTAATELRRDGQRVWAVVSFDRASAEALATAAQGQ